MSKYPRTDAARLKDVCRHMAMAEECTRMEYELNEAKARIKRMEEAGDKMDPMNDTECECDDRSVLICKYCFDSSTRWFKAKEHKP